MNRFNKEEMKKRKAYTQEMRDRKKQMRDINALARRIHAEESPEEYDCMFDSYADTKDRATGKNPMNADYIAKVNARRKKKGFDSLSENGTPPNDKTYICADDEARRRLSIGTISTHHQWMLSSSKFTKALEFAVGRHAEKNEQTSVPYVNHLMRTASLVREFGDGEEEAIAELLQDVIENSEASIDEVRDMFGDYVADMLAQCVRANETDPRKIQNAGWNLYNSWNYCRTMKVFKRDIESKEQGAASPASIPSGVQEIKFYSDSGEVIFSYEDSDPYEYVVVRHGDYTERFLTANFTWFIGTLSEEGLLDRFLDGVINRDTRETGKVSEMVQEVIEARCKKLNREIIESMARKIP